MKIAVYHNLSSGGAKRALAEMARCLAHDHTIDIYTLSCAEQAFGNVGPYSRRHQVFPFVPLPVVRRPFGRVNQGVRVLDLLRLRALQRKIARQINAGGYDLAFVHHCQFGQAPALLQFLTIPTLYYCQEPPRMAYEPPVDRPYTRYSRAQRFGNVLDPLPALYRSILIDLDRRSTRSASCVLVNSAYSLETLYRTYGVFARICYLGVDVLKFCSQGQAHGDYVLSVGQLNPRKAFDFIVRGVALMDRLPRPAVVIASNLVDAREKAYLVDLAKQLDVQLRILPQVSDADLVDLYCRARLTVYTPIMEPFGLVPIESMACSTAVVGVAEGGVRESVVHGKTGWLVERELKLFADVVSHGLANPGECDAMGKAGRLHVIENWSWDSTARRLNDLIREVA